MKKSTGSCICSTIHFEIEGDFENFFLCHCKYCQKDTGSAFAANLFSKTARLVWLKGEQYVTVFNLPETLHVKAFCKICGSALPNLQMKGKILVVPASSLDSDIDLKPNAHIFVSSRSNWEFNLDKIRAFKALPTDA